MTAGRKRKEGVIRYPSGKINLTAERQKKVTMATAAEARVRQYGMDASGAASQEAGYALGRLYLAGGLGRVSEKRNGAEKPEVGPAEILLEAGNRLHRDYDAYYRLTGIPSPHPRAFDMGRVRGLGSDPDPATARAASNRMMGLEGALGLADEQGRPVTSLTKRVILADEDTQNWTPTMIAKVVRGLKSVAIFYGLGD